MKLKWPHTHTHIDEAISNITQHYKSKTNNLLLLLGGKSYAALQDKGKLTLVGDYGFNQSE